VSEEDRQRKKQGIDRKLEKAHEERLNPKKDRKKATGEKASEANKEEQSAVEHKCTKKQLEEETEERGFTTRSKARPTLKLTGPSPIPTRPHPKYAYPLTKEYYRPSNSKEDWVPPGDHPCYLEMRRNQAERSPEEFNKFYDELKREEPELYAKG
jgi:hypothetical protein